MKSPRTSSVGENAVFADDLVDVEPDDEPLRAVQRPGCLPRGLGFFRGGGRSVENGDQPVHEQGHVVEQLDARNVQRVGELGDPALPSFEDDGALSPQKGRQFSWHVVVPR